MRVATCLVVAAAVAASCGRVGFEAARAGGGGDATAADGGGSVPAVVGTALGPLGPPGGAVVVTPPAGTTAGDVLLVAIYANQLPPALAAPPGWTTALDTTDAVHQYHASFFEHRAVAGDPATFAFALGSGSSNDAAWGAVAVRGAGGSDASAGEATLLTGIPSPSEITFTAPGVAISRADDLLVALFLNDQGYGSAYTWTPPAGMTELASNQRVALFAATRPAVGALAPLVTAIDVTGTTGSAGGAVRVTALHP